MKLFKIDDEHGNSKHIFARGFDHAAEQFVTWQMVNEVLMGSFKLQRVTLGSRSPKAAAHLREALALGGEGIGAYDDTRGWQIRPIEDERDLPDLI